MPQFNPPHDLITDDSHQTFSWRPTMIWTEQWLSQNLLRRGQKREGCVDPTLFSPKCLMSPDVWQSLGLFHKRGIKVRCVGTNLNSRMLNRDTHYLWPSSTALPHSIILVKSVSACFLLPAVDQRFFRSIKYEIANKKIFLCPSLLLHFIDQISLPYISSPKSSSLLKLHTPHWLCP